MYKNLPFVRCQLSVFLLALLLSMLFSTIAFASEHDNDLPEEIASAMERDLGLDPSELDRNLHIEREAAPLIDQARAAFGEHFGGGWIERDENGFPRIVIATSSSIATQEAASRIGINGSESHVELREVRFSQEQLENIVESFNQANEHAIARNLDGIHSWGIDLARNRVVVVTSPDVSERALDFFAASRVDLDALDFEVSEHEPSTLANIVGGFRYNSCSIGFAVRQGSTPGFVTAGHCGSAGSIVRISGVTVGSVQQSHFPGSDAAWANVRASDNLYNLVWRYSGNTTYAVTGSSEAPLGATVCRSGFRTGWRCGTLTRNNVTVNYGQGSVSGLRESNACAGQGDSGGSWVAGGNQAQGVTSGGALGGDGTNCGIPQNQRRTWFQRLNPMLNSYGLTLVTN